MYINIRIKTKNLINEGKLLTNKIREKVGDGLGDSWTKGEKIIIIASFTVTDYKLQQMFLLIYYGMGIRYII